MFWRRSRIYADAAAATPLGPAARKEFARLLGLFANPSALHHEAVVAKKELERARTRVAKSIGAHPDEIIFTASGTEANNLALHGVEGHAVTVAIEHPSVLEPLRARGEVSEVGVDEKGVVFPNAILSAVRPDTAIISVQLVNSEIGAIQPVREIAKSLRRGRENASSSLTVGPAAPALRSSEAFSRPLFHTDASQAPLWMDIKVEALGVDLMTLDGQKILGPKGVGCLYVRRGVRLKPLLRGGGQERGLRSGTENVAAAASFAATLEWAQQGALRRARTTALVRDFLWHEIQRLIPDSQLNGPETQGARVANNLNISIPGLDGEMAVVSMDALGVAVSTRSACATGQEGSHVIAALGPKARPREAVRITLLPNATRSEARRIAAALLETAERYRR